MTLYTIGHSTRSIEEFISLLQSYRIEILADVRAFPSSSKFPYFNRKNLEANLFQSDIKYHWLGKELGGYRKKKTPYTPALPFDEALSHHIKGEKK